MADEKDLAKAMFESVVDRVGSAGQGATFIGIAGRLDVNTTTTATIRTDITPEAAKVAIEVAKCTYALPAQEQTLQEQERTKQTRQPTWRVGICVVGLMAGFVTMAIRPSVAMPVAIAVGVLAGGFGGAEIVSRLKDQRPPMALPPKGGSA